MSVHTHQKQTKSSPRNRKATKALSRVFWAAGITAIAAFPSAASAQDTIAYSWVSSIFGGDSQVYEIHLETGEARAVADVPGKDLDGGTALPDGRIVAIDGYNAEFWEMMPNQRALGRPRLSGVDAGMAYDTTTDTLYAISGGQFSNFESSLLYTIDPQTGQSTRIGEDPVHYANSLAIDANGNAYAIDLVWNTRLYSVDLATGQLSYLSEVVSATGEKLTGGGLSFAPDGTLWMTNYRDPDIYKLDPATGIATWVSSISVHQSGFRWGFLAIPFAEQPCYADCDTSTGIGVLDVFDFLCFQDSFVGGEPYACDCDTSTGPGVCDVFDFLCFQDAFVASCP